MFLLLTLPVCLKTEELLRSNPSIIIIYALSARPPLPSFSSKSISRTEFLSQTFFWGATVLVAFLLSLLDFSTISAILLLLHVCVTAVYVRALKMSLFLTLLSEITLFKTNILYRLKVAWPRFSSYFVHVTKRTQFPMMAHHCPSLDSQTLNRTGGCWVYPLSFLNAWTLRNISISKHRCSLCCQISLRTME